MKSHTEYLTFNLPVRMGFERITPEIERIVSASGIKEGMVLVNAMHITRIVALLSFLRRMGGSRDCMGSSYTLPSGISVPTSQQLGIGRLIEVDDYNAHGLPSPSTYTYYTYDPITGNQASITTPEGTINYTYNDVTGQLQETTSSGNDEFYYYNMLGQLQDVYTLKLNGTPHATFSGTNLTTSPPTFSNGTPLTTAYTYDPAGNLLTVTDPNGVMTAYTYNSLNQLTDELVTNTTTTEPLFQEQTYYYSNGLKENQIDTRYNTNGTTVSSTTVTWTYDNERKLLSETSATTGGPSSLNYTDAFTYDLDGNRLSEKITGGTTGNGNIIYSYNHDDQLSTENGSYTTTANNYQTIYTYYPDGSLETQTRTGSGAVGDIYVYDLRSRMISDTTTASGTAITDYSYDTSSVLASETTNAGTASAVTIYYLNDPNNLTGYTKAIQESTTLGGSPTLSYILGSDIIAQSGTSNGTAYLLTDGHGSTRALINTSGQVMPNQTFDYDAFGDALDFNPATVQTTWLFGGDGFYDPASGWTYQLARWRNGFWFTQSDTTSGSKSDPISLHKYLYANANPISGRDPSGHLDVAELTVVAGLSLTLIGLGVWWAGSHFNHPVLAGVGQNITVFGGGVIVAGAGFLIAPEYGAYVIATEIPVFIANLVYTWGQGGLVDRAQNVVTSAAVPNFLSGYYYYATSQAHSLPPSGRIVVRGATRLGDIPDASGTSFAPVAVPLLPGDYVYDYALTGNSNDGGMAVVVGEVLPGGKIQVDGNYKFTSGTASALPFARPVAAPPPQILVTK